MTDEPPALPPYRVRDSGDAWVYGPDGDKYWGRFGAAGLLVWHPQLGVLLQHRIAWSHFGGTWGLPGGALKAGETPVEGAMREASEEAGVDPALLEVLFTSALDLGFWQYTTVVVRAVAQFEPVIGDAESEALAWVPTDEVTNLILHPGFGASWPELRSRLR
jgi:8-oxo-dGTP diphosphatase